MRIIGLVAFITVISSSIGAADALRKLNTWNDSKGWEAVGRLDLDGKGFCTGALIEPNLVLTAAHCLHDKRTGERVDPKKIEFRAGLRNGRAAAYRWVRRAVPHPDYAFLNEEKLEQVPYDLALLELEAPIRLPSILPYATATNPRRGDQIGVVSYARDRAEVASLQEQCEVLESRPGVLVMSCDVDFGSSGSPVFDMVGGQPRVVSVVAAKAELNGRKVSLGVNISQSLPLLRRALSERPKTEYSPTLPQIGRETTQPSDIGAKFLRPPPKP